MINYKYFILSTAFIFIALGIGLVIGFMFDAQQIMVSQKQDIITQLEEEFNNIKLENESLKKHNKVLETEKNKQSTSLELLYKKAINNRLHDNKIGLITYNIDENIENYNKAITDAGGKILTHIRINNINLEILEGRNELSSKNKERFNKIFPDISYMLKDDKNRKIINNRYDIEKELENDIDEFILILNTQEKKTDEYLPIIEELYYYCSSNKVPFICVLDTQMSEIIEMDLPILYLEEPITTRGGKIELITMLEDWSLNLHSDIEYSLQ